MKSMQKENLVVEYREDCLQSLLDIESASVPTGHYLHNHPDITPALRDKLVEWVRELADNQHASKHTIQMAISLIDKYTAAEEIRRPHFQLVGLVCLMISLKYNESVFFSLAQVMQVTHNRYSAEEFILVEIHLLSTFEWHLKLPTAATFVRQLLYITDVDYDFRVIIGKSDAFAMLCYEDYNLAMYSPLVIAVVSVVCVLEQYKHVAFRDQWLALLYEKVGLDFAYLDECKRTLLNKLSRITSEEHAGFLYELRQHSFLNILKTFRP